MVDHNSGEDAAGGRVAFFDVDDTLLARKSMFRFLEFDILASGRPLGEYETAMRELDAVKAAGASREEANKFFYRQFRGRLVADVVTCGAQWFRAESERGGLFNGRVLSALRDHRNAGDAVVLVSGSFPPCLDPVGAFVRANAIACSRPEIRDGRYTGHLAAPMIGSRKAQAVRAAAASRGARLDRCWAYGDHASDLPMLRAVGHAVVVGDDPDMREYARNHSWPTLAAA